MNGTHPIPGGATISIYDTTVVCFSLFGECAVHSTVVVVSKVDLERRFGTGVAVCLVGLPGSFY